MSDSLESNLLEAGDAQGGTMKKASFRRIIAPIFDSLKSVIEPWLVGVLSDLRIIEQAKTEQARETLLIGRTTALSIAATAFALILYIVPMPANTVDLSLTLALCLATICVATAITHAFFSELLLDLEHKPEILLFGKVTGGGLSGIAMFSLAAALFFFILHASLTAAAILVIMLIYCQRWIARAMHKTASAIQDIESSPSHQRSTTHSDSSATEDADK